MRVFVLTIDGWMLENEIFTPSTGKIKKHAKSTPIKATKEQTTQLRSELPMIREVRGYYYIQCV